MTLLISNADVAQVLTMDATIAALETSYRDLASGEAVCRPRIDIQVPTSDPARTYQWGTMEGGSTRGYFAIRMKSDVIYEREYAGALTQEKYCGRPGLYCGLVLLTSIESGEPLAFINDGVLQHMRVGADGGIGARYLAREDAKVVGMLGSGGMARSHIEALLRVRPIERVQVYSPTPSHREAFAREVRERHGIDAIARDSPELVYRGADIVAAVTDSAVPVLDGRLLEPGTHLINVGGGGRPDEKSLERIDVYLRFGSTPAPWGRPELAIDDEYLTWAARPGLGGGRKAKKSGHRGHGVLLRDRMVTLAELMQGRPGRTSADQITYSERGNLQGAQFFAVAATVYEAARAAGLGRELPTEWFLQDVRN
jgi:ornithine cyclodeaminase/alanine dehydrogenase-like protein (mu-crystallin family)